MSKSTWHDWIDGGEKAGPDTLGRVQPRLLAPPDAYVYAKGPAVALLYLRDPDTGRYHHYQDEDLNYPVGDNASFRDYTPVWFKPVPSSFRPNPGLIGLVDEEGDFWHFDPDSFRFFLEVENGLGSAEWPSMGCDMERPAEEGCLALSHLVFEHPRD